MEYFTLNNGVKMPALGYGTHSIPTNQTQEKVTKAIQLGYRAIDTAQNYHNEKEIGQAIQASGINRHDLFITTKTATDGYQDTKLGIDQSLQALQVDYVDLLLVNWPTMPTNSVSNYTAIEEAYNEGKARAIGFSNFNRDQMKLMLSNIDVTPAVEQIETHLLWQQHEIIHFLKEENILPVSWSPLGHANPQLLDQPELVKIAQKHHKKPAQVALRFLIQLGIPVAPKANRSIHMQQNLAIFDFNLSSQGMTALSHLDQHRSLANWPSSMMDEQK